MRKFIIKEASYDDLPKMVNLQLNSQRYVFETFYKEIPALPNLSNLIKIWKNRLEKRTHKVFLFYSDNLLCGYGALAMYSRTVASLEGLFVRKELIGNGIGSYILNYLFVFLKKYRFTSCKLFVLEKNERASMLYKHRGFLYTDVTRVVTLGDKDYKLLEMNKILE